MEGAGSSRIQNWLEVLALSVRQDVRVCGLCRSLAISQLAIGISTGLLIVTSRADTLLLFTGRACSMGSFAILYVYTPEVHAFPGPIMVSKHRPIMHSCM